MKEKEGIILFDASIYDRLTAEERYEDLLSSLEALLSDEKDSLTNLCNASALIYALIGDLNWCGFYLMKNNQLVLGPFQGMPACTRIKPGKGVCGAACTQKQVMIIHDVHEFKDHIACDAASNSEMVLPIINKGKLYGVLDLDSIKTGRFKELEKKYLEQSIIVLNKYIDWEKLIKM